MEKLEHELWIVQLFNAVFGPPWRRCCARSGRTSNSGEADPDYLVMVGLIVVG